MWKTNDEMASSLVDIENYTMAYEAERSSRGKKGQLLLINQKGINQCYISMGMLGVSIDDPDGKVSFYSYKYFAMAGNCCLRGF